MPGEPVVERSGSSSMEDEAKTKAEKPMPEHSSPAATPSKKPNFMKRIWMKIGLDSITFILMTKGALPPVIVLAAYQSDAWAKKYSTLGYLCAIFSFLTLAIQPRAKFIQATILSIFALCFSCALALLQIRCVTLARQHTNAPTTSTATATGESGSKQSVAYNSSAAVVDAVFMFVYVYFVNMLRAKRPQLMIPTIQASIIIIVSSSYCLDFPNMTAGLSFVQRLLETTLTGVGIAAGVSLFIFPMTSRTIAGKQAAGMLALTKASIMAHSQYLMTISHESVNDKNVTAEGSPPTLSAEAQALQGIRNNLGELFAKLNLEISFARKEIAYGHLHPHHFNEIVVHLREIILPVSGMTTFIDIMQSVRGRYKAAGEMIGSDETLMAMKKLKSEEWDTLMSISHDQAGKLKDILCQGLTHIGYQLKISPKPKSPKGDVEKSGDALPVPGDANFTDMLEKEIETFRAHRDTALQRWCTNKGIDLPTSFWDDPAKHYTLEELQAMTESVRQKESQQQLYLILYIEYLTWSIGVAILSFSRWADARVTDETMTNKRLIVPGWKKILKLLQSAFNEEDSGDLYLDEGDGAQIYMGDAFKHRKNPEHLPPSSFVQKFTNYFRLIPAHFRSDEASFGFRATVAVMSIGVMAFIEQTFAFFQKQRILWALIMVAISMSPTTGQGIFGFLARIFGSMVAMALSLTIWYMADSKTGAVIPLFGVLIAAPGIYFLLKFPKFAIVGILSVVTSILIIGYELQERKIGIALATSNGQPFYPVYELAPYRLATVTAGIAVCFIWTYFPYPITTHSTLRKDMGATLYLLANFYSCVHSTIEMRLRLGKESDPNDPHSPMIKLDKARVKVFKKCLVMLNRLREHSAFLRFDPSFGGPFPKDQYDAIIHSLQNIFNYISLMSYSSSTFLPNSTSGRGSEGTESQWLSDFRTFTADLNLTSHDLTSTLCLISASMSNTQPLPPYLKPLESFDLAERMESVDPELLSLKHVSEPCYAAFAVLEVASSLVAEEVGRVVEGVRELVGEVDFSFHVGESEVATRVASENGEGDTGDAGGNGKGKVE